jgi:DNA-binding NarL/FixJ family response regulator
VRGRGFLCAAVSTLVRRSLVGTCAGHVMAQNYATKPRPDGKGLKTPTLLSRRQWHSLALSLGLSNRESEVVQAVFDARTEISIAQKLGISTHTVHTHLDRLYRKLNVNTRSELILRIFAEHLTVGRPRRARATLPRTARSRKPPRVSRRRTARKG